MKRLSLTPLQQVPPPWRSLARRSIVLAAGTGLVALLVYMATWVLFGSERIARDAAIGIGCVILAFCVLVLTISEIVEK